MEYTEHLDCTYTHIENTGKFIMCSLQQNPLGIDENMHVKFSRGFPLTHLATTLLISIAIPLPRLCALLRLTYIKKKSRHTIQRRNGVPCLYIGILDFV
ncbi:hypothetical protein CW304_18950 [Bacillus sp. UFRGS-B20]|nr:hypothetical protein CW304_18950 [Bacillus sp. UFRGS-B20]